MWGRHMAAPLSKSVSRVLYLTAICLALPLPAGSSHPLRTIGPIKCPPAVLLRIEFTGPHCSQAAGELLPRLSTLTASMSRRYISVALFLKSPSAGVTRYPCPMEPGLSSCKAFRPVHTAAWLALTYFTTADLICPQLIK